MIGIIDYGLGNVQAFCNIYKRANISSKLVKNEKDFENVSRLILPGVGAFDHAMNLLQNSGMYDIVNHLVLVEKKPVLGVCVGMQMMGFSSEEGISDGLGWIPGKVKKITGVFHDKEVFLPHMGWNAVRPSTYGTLFHNLSEGVRFYFLHSFYFEPEDISDSYSTTLYSNTFTSSIRRNNIYGVQFHPEKSHGVGVQLLKNFSEV